MVRGPSNSQLGRNESTNMATRASRPIQGVDVGIISAGQVDAVAGRHGSGGLPDPRHGGTFCRAIISPKSSNCKFRSETLNVLAVVCEHRNTVCSASFAEPVESELVLGACPGTALDAITMSAGRSGRFALIKNPRRTLARCDARDALDSRARKGGEPDGRPKSNG